MRLPRGLRRGHQDEIACSHRDVSCCQACIDNYTIDFEEVVT